MSRVFQMALAIALSISGLPALAATPAATAAPGGGPSAAPPLPASLNCAVSYRMRGVNMSWIDTSSAYAWDDPQDDENLTVDLPFPFIYYGARYTSVTINTNGWISFVEGGCAACAHMPIPTPADPGFAVAGAIGVFWRDLDPQASHTVPDQRYIRLKTVGSAPRRAWVVTWERFPLYRDPATEYTFQVVLYETTNVIRFQYLSMTGDQSQMTIGIENQLGTEGVEYSYNQNRNMEGQALEFQPTLPSLNCGAATPLSCGARLTNQAMSATSSRVQYGCSNGVFFAGEALYALDLTQVTEIALNVVPNDFNKTIRAFLMTSCDLCNCSDGDATRLRTVLGPGRYYVAVDGPSAPDTGTFDLQLDCTPVLGPPTGSVMRFGTAGECEMTAEFDRFADGRGVLAVPGMTKYTSDRSFAAVRVDGARTYATNPSRSYCPQFNRMISWTDDATDKAVVYWSFPEGQVTQVVYGTKIPPSTGPACCGLRIETTIKNTDLFPHFYELRAIHAADFGPGTTNCLGDPNVEAGPLHVDPNPTDYTVEQNLTCDTSATPPGLCGVRCEQPTELKSADDLLPKMVLQNYGNATKQAVQGEWVRYYDANAICDTPVGDPWMGASLPTPDPNSACTDLSAVVFAWRLPPGTNTACTLPSDPCLQPGQSASFTHFIGQGCRLNPTCSPCLASADVRVPAVKMCLGQSQILDGSSSGAAGCAAGGGTVQYQWYRDVQPVPGATNPTYTFGPGENAPGDYYMEFAVSCQPPPSGFPCVDVRATTINVADCSLCRAAATFTASATVACLGQTVTFDGTASTLTDCPGTQRYTWYRDGVAIPGVNGPTLQHVEDTAGQHDFYLEVACDAPPAGLNCSSAAAPVRVDYSGQGGTPSDRGNTLLGAKSLVDVVLSWAQALDPETEAYDLLRGSTKAELAAPGPPVRQSGILPATPTFTDSGAVTDFSNWLYFYRVRGTGCGGVQGPY